MKTSGVKSIESILKGLNEKCWHTADGKSIPFSEVTHAHWSNIYWYHRYIFEITILEDERERCGYLMHIAETQIKVKFKGEILDWVPIYDNEKRWFKSQNTRKVLVEKYKEIITDVKFFLKSIRR